MYLFWIIVYIVLLLYFPLNAFLSPLTIRKIRKEERKGRREGDKQREKETTMHACALITNPNLLQSILAGIIIDFICSCCLN